MYDGVVSINRGDLPKSDDELRNIIRGRLDDLAAQNNLPQHLEPALVHLTEDVLRGVLVEKHKLQSGQVPSTVDAVEVPVELPKDGKAGAPRWVPKVRV